MAKTIKLNKNFYEIKAINMAVTAYKGIAEIMVSEASDEYELKITKTNYDVNMVELELCNYILAVMNK